MLTDGDADTSGILLMSNTKIDPWDPSSLRLAPADAADSQLAPRRGRRPPSTRGRFIAGPVDVAWLSRARKLGVTALWVGLGLWHLKGLRRTDTFVVFESHDAGMGRLARCQEPGSESSRESGAHRHRAAGKAQSPRVASSALTPRPWSVRGGPIVDGCGGVFFSRVKSRRPDRE